MHDILKQTRLNNNFTSKYMAEKLNISAPFYSQLETGKRNLTYDMALRIAKIFDLKPDDLFYVDHLKTVD